MKTAFTMMIDDERSLPVDIHLLDYDSAMDVLASLNVTHSLWKVETLFLDHDLGNPEPWANGYSILEWLLSKRNRIPSIVLLTANPVGFDKMKRALVAEGYTQNLDDHRVISLPVDDIRVCSWNFKKGEGD